MSQPTEPRIDVEEFVGLLMASERRVFSYILSLLPNVADAQDVLQETSIVLWRRLAEYEPDTDFAAWACRVAFNVVRNFRAKQHRCRVKFDEQLLTAVATDAESIREELDLAQSTLFDCMRELPAGDRDLLQRRYESGATIKSVAAAVGRSAEGLYKAMRRIHDTLYDCIQRRLKSEGIHVRKS